MKLFGFRNHAEMDEGVALYRKTEGAVLLDVRTPEEYAQGHVPESVNLPLDEIQTVLERFPERDTPLFVHCRSGARSARAVKTLVQLGYGNVVDIGGILNYHGKVE